MAQIVRRILGVDFDGKPIYAPKHAHSLTLSAAGGGKTTCGAVPWLQSLIADHARCIVVTDSKEGEISAQTAAMAARFGRKVAIIDDFGILGEGNVYRVTVNRFGAVISSYIKANGELIFSTENACQALIEEPPRDSRNAYWRDEPRTLIEFSLNTLLIRDPELATGGGVWTLIADPKTLIKAARIEAEEGDEALSALAHHVLAMSESEHWGQHRSAAAKALRIYGAGSVLHLAGVDANITHEQLINEHYVVFLVGPVRHMERLGADYALQLQSFMEVVLSGNAGPVSFILDEFTNAPLKALISQLTTMRGYGGTCHMIAQSRSEIERKYGDKETLTIEENAIIKQWFGFSSYREAEQVSRAIGETQTRSRGLGFNSANMDVSGNIGTGKERFLTPDQLMNLPQDEQIIHAKGIGFIHAKKIAQNEIGPTAHHLQPNPLEGGGLPPDIKVTLPTNSEEEDT